MITKQQIDDLKGDRNSDVQFMYNEGDILTALIYGYDKHYLIKPRLMVSSKPNLITIRDGVRKYDIRLY